jgi:hypothetical protein
LNAGKETSLLFPFLRGVVLFRVRSYLVQMVRAFFDREVETPVARHTGLPNTLIFIVLLGAQ